MNSKNKLIIRFSWDFKKKIILNNIPEKLIVKDLLNKLINLNYLDKDLLPFIEVFGYDLNDIIIDNKVQIIFSKEEKNGISNWIFPLIFWIIQLLFLILSIIKLNLKWILSFLIILNSFCAFLAIYFEVDSIFWPKPKRKFISLLEDLYILFFYSILPSFGNEPFETYFNDNNLENN